MSSAAVWGKGATNAEVQMRPRKGQEGEKRWGCPGPQYRQFKSLSTWCREACKRQLTSSRFGPESVNASRPGCFYKYGKSRS